jgi:regulator of protease activity HflC (stomatin/prohibitin superfamily)
METAFGWLGSLMEMVGSLFPRLVIVQSTHGGVSFVRGKNPRKVSPGLMWYWPVVTEVVLYPVVRQSLNLPSQTLTTSDNKTITFSAVIVYDVPDILKALTVQWDLEDTLQDVSMAAVREFVLARTFDELRTESGVRLKDTIHARIQQYGVAVKDAWVTDLAETKVVTMILPDGGSTNTLLLEEE